MLASPTPPKRVPRHLTSGLITLIYLLFGTLWIVFSDRLLAILITDAGLLAQVQTIKGEGFILMTALMLYLLIRQSLKRESQIEQALRRSETRLEGIISSATDAILTIDRDQRIILFNEAAETLFEYPTAEMLGQRLDLLLPERYRAGHGGHITRFGQTGRSSRSMGDHGEVMALRADGTEFPIEAMISQTEVGGEKLYTVIIRDITRRKETEAALRSALQTLTLHVENSPLAVIEWDHLFRVRRWSKRAEEIFGWPAAEVLGKHPTEWPFIHPDDAVAVTERMVNLVQQRQARSVHRHRNYTQAGAIIEGEWYESALYNEAGELVSVLSLVQNITLRQQARADLEASERRFRATFEQAAVGLGHLSLTGQWLWVNEKLSTIFGCAGPDLQARDIRDFAPPDEGADDLLNAGQLLLSGELTTYTQEKRFLRPDGQFVWVNLTASLMRDGDGQPQYFIVAIEDITLRKTMETQLRQAQKMEAVGQVAGGVAHDFNNLLTVILSYCNLLFDEMAETHPLRADLQEIHAAGQRAADLTRQLLAFSRQQVLHPRILDLNQVVTDVERMLSRLIGEDIDLTLHLGGQLRSIEVDPGQIEQVLLNLAVNARDAMPNGGRIVIETRNIELDEAYAHQHLHVEPGPYVMLAFTDTGHGMDAETRAQIFDPFFTTKESGKGTGLGLATVHGIVAQSGGDIWVYSEPSYGTTFKLYFPMVQPEATTAASAAAVAPLPTGTETILLVDDDPMVRTVTRRLLDRYSYQIIEAADGPQALYIMQAHETPIHLLLTDLVLSSDMNGRQLAEQVQTGWPETRVLYMSGYTDNVIGQHGILSADTFFLQKPFSTDELLGKIRAALQGETTSSAALHQSIPGNRPVTRNGAR